MAEGSGLRFAILTIAAVRRESQHRRPDPRFFDYKAHGTVDDNVPPNNTLLVVDALVKANQDFDLLMLPNQRHGYGNASNYMTRHRL